MSTTPVPTPEPALKATIITAVGTFVAALTTALVTYSFTKDPETLATIFAAFGVAVSAILPAVGKWIRERVMPMSKVDALVGLRTARREDLRRTIHGDDGQSVGTIVLIVFLAMLAAVGLYFLLRDVF